MNRERLIEAINNSNSYRFPNNFFRRLPRSLQNDKEVVLAIVRKTDGQLQWVSESFQNDKEIVLAAVKTDFNNMFHASLAMKNDQDVMLAAVRGQYKQFNMIDFDKDPFEEDICEYIQYDSIFNLASESLKNNQDAILAALARDYRVIDCISESLKSNVDFMIRALNAIHTSKAMFWTENVQVKLKEFFDNNQELAVAATKVLGWTLEFVMSESLRNDRDFNLIAVKNDGHALKYVPEPLKSDKEIVVAAIAHKNGCSIFSVPESLQNDPEILVAIHVYSKYNIYSDSPPEYASQEMEEFDSEEESHNSDREEFYRESNWEDERQNQEEMMEEYGSMMTALEQYSNENNCDILCLASKYGMTCNAGIGTLLELHPDQLKNFDPLTGLCPFMLCAASPVCDLETVYEMIKACPDLVKKFS